MQMTLALLSALAFAVQVTVANLPMTILSGPKVTLDNATVLGKFDGNVAKFHGIPFALPPTGNRRFRLPVPIPPYTENFEAIHYGSSCPQLARHLPLDGLPGDAANYITNSIFNTVTPESEDCFSINIIKPKHASADAKLPVLVWIFPSAFQMSGTTIYNGGPIVRRSITMGTPIIFVSMNYRLAGLGFLASQEVKDAGVGNLGLHDQREALRWIQKYISAFGGDPSKVTIWGDSAGAISASLHMLTNDGNTEGLFRGAYMQSGAPIPVGDITHGQKYYDAIVEETECKGTPDTLDCLRGVEYKKLKAAIDKSPGVFSYQSLVLAWLPRVDGVFLKDNPQELVKQGSVANIPFVTGNVDDEGTVFSLSSRNVTDEKEFVAYVKQIYLPNRSDSDVANLLKYYPHDLTQGSPFDTGESNALTPQFKRIAAFQGDAVFQAPRRFFLQQRAGKQNTWSYSWGTKVTKRLKHLPILGSAHATDILNFFLGEDMAEYLINFVVRLDPNGGILLPWPKYDVKKPKLLTFQAGHHGRLNITDDTYRKEAMEFLLDVMLKNPL